MDTCFWMPLLWVLGASVLAGLLGWYLGKKDSSSSNSSDVAKDLKIQNLQRDLMQVKEKTDNSLASLGRETSELQDRVNLWKEKFNKLQLQTSGLDNLTPEDDELNELQSQYRLLKDENSNLIQEIESVKLTQASSTTDVELKEQTAELKQLQFQHKLLQEEIANLKEVREAMKVVKSEQIETDLELKELKSQHQIIQDENIVLSEEIEAMRLVADVPVKKETQIVSIADEVKESYESKIKGLKSKLKKSKAKLKKAKSKSSKRTEIEITKSIDIETLKKLLDKVPLKKVSERVIRKK